MPHDFGDFRSALHNNDIDALIEMSHEMTPEELLYLVQSGKKLAIAAALRSYANMCHGNLRLEDTLLALPRDKTIVLRNYPLYGLISRYTGSIFVFDSCDLDKNSVLTAVNQCSNKIKGNGYSLLPNYIIHHLKVEVLDRLHDDEFMAIRNGESIRFIEMPEQIPNNPCAEIHLDVFHPQHGLTETIGINMIDAPHSGANTDE